MSILFVKNGGYEVNGKLGDDDSSHLRSILLNSVDRPRDCDSESTVTVNSEARMNMMSPVSTISLFRRIKVYIARRLHIGKEK